MALDGVPCQLTVWKKGCMNNSYPDIGYRWLTIAHALIAWWEAPAPIARVITGWPSSIRDLIRVAKAWTGVVGFTKMMLVLSSPTLMKRCSDSLGSICSGKASIPCAMVRSPCAGEVHQSLHVRNSRS